MLSFLFPWGFIGFVSVPLVIAFHLLRERQRRYVVSSLWLWKFLKPQIHGAKYSRLPITWLLILDLIIAVLLSAALTMPYVTSSVFSKSSVHKFFVIDVSTSMLAKEGTSSRFAKAKQEVISQLLNLSGNDRATIIAFNHKTTLIGDTNRDLISDIIERLDKLSVGGRGNAVVDALLMAKANYSLEKPNEIHLYSDGSNDLKSIPKEVKGIIYHSMGSSANNQAILQIETKGVGDNKLEIFSRIANFSDEDVQRIIALLVDENPINSQRVDLAARQIIKQRWVLEDIPLDKLKTVHLVLVGEDDLSEDDDAYYSMKNLSKATVSLVTDKEYPLTRALKSFAGLNLLYSPTAQYQPQLLADVTVFRGFSPAWLPSGTVIFIEPRGTVGGDSQMQMNLTAHKISLTPDQVPIVHDKEKIKEIDFSGVRWENLWQLDVVPDDFNTLISIGEYPLLLEGWKGASHVYILLADLDSGNFSEHPSFVVLLGNIIYSAKSIVSDAQLSLGESIHLPSPKQLYSSVTIIAPNQSVETFRSQWDVIWSNTYQPGFYEVHLQNNTGKVFTSTIGVNAGDYQESNIKPQVEVETKPLALAQKSQKQQLVLTPWLLGAALIFLGIEAVVAWRR